MAPASSSAGGLSNEIKYAIHAVKQLRVKELKDICRSAGLPLSGRKVNLQERIEQYIRESMSIGHIDPWRPKTIVILISIIRQTNDTPQYIDIWADVKSGKYPTPTGQLLSSMGIPYDPIEEAANTTVSPSSQNITPNQKQSLNDKAPFRLTPFYNLQYQVAKSSYRLVRAAGRGVGAVRFTFTGHEWLKLQSDSKKFRLCLFCWPVPTRNYGANHKEYIEFPSPNEILFNGHKITENVRGLKNKPGTAKPADLTTYIRPSPQINTLDLIYAYTKSDFQMACYVTEIISPDELLQSVVLKHPRISKKLTLEYIKKTMSEEDEDDLITTSTVLSLQCPISYTRMKYPAQSRSCKHLQCFDALWYLHSQMQVPTWQCPVCSLSIPLENLVISEYVDEIIKNSNEEVEQVELSPDGSWKAFIEEETPASNHGNNNTNTNQPSPVKKEHSNNDMHNIPNEDHGEAVVISLDSSDDEDKMVTANETPELPPSILAPSHNSSRPTSNGHSEENSGNIEADLPLSQYIRRSSTNTVNGPAPVPVLASKSLLGLSVNPQIPAINGNLPPFQQDLSTNIPVGRDRPQHHSLPSLHSNAAAQLPVPSNVPPISNSTLFGSTNPTRSPPSVNSSNNSNSILGIGGNLPNLNLPHNGSAPVNPFTTNNTSPPITNVGSTSPLPPLTNMFRSTSNGTNNNNSTITINERPIAVPHARNPSTRRAKDNISPFIPRKPYPPNRAAVIPRKRTEVVSNEPVNRDNPLLDNNSSTARINPLTNRPYQEHGNMHTEVNPLSNVNPFYPPRLNRPETNNSNDSDIIDLTSD